MKNIRQDHSMILVAILLDFHEMWQKLTWMVTAWIQGGYLSKILVWELISMVAAWIQGGDLLKILYRVAEPFELGGLENFEKFQKLVKSSFLERGQGVELSSTWNKKII